MAIENVRLSKELQAGNTQLTEALEQQTATSEILRVIASSPTDLQPVLDAMAESAARLCASPDADIFRLDGDVLRLVAYHGPLTTRLGFTVPAIRGTVGGRAVLDRQTVQVADLQAGAEEFPESSAIARSLGHRTILSVPLLREGIAIGAIALRRTEVQLFTDKQIALLRTFADQAVIAIENVRLFTELQEKNRALTQAHAQVTETLEQQTATSEILKVIASTPTDLTPVFETILRSAVRLFNAYGGSIRRFDGELVHLAAVTSPNPEADDRLRRMFPHPPDREYATERPILDGTVAHIPDTEDEPSELTRRLARDFGFRRLLGVPMLREGQIVGVISVTGSEPGPYSARQIALLRTFADQAVIAIENVRLFTELETRNRDLTEALEQQTATAEILGVMSRSPADVGPVFDVILASATRLCVAHLAVLWLYEGDDRFRAVAFHGASQQYRTWLSGSVHRVPPALFRVRGPWRPAHIEDATAIPHLDSHPLIRASVEVEGMRTILGVPLVKQDELVGAVTIYRREVSSFGSARRLNRDLRQSSSDRYRKRPAVQGARSQQPGDRRQEPSDRGRQPAQVRVPRQHVA